jgi:3-oxoacyl-[acyl-carrier protein] reductase
MIDPQLTNKVALVTGANHPKGIGRATALALAAQGTAVFLTGYGRPPLDDTITAITSAGGRAAGTLADLSDPAVIPWLFDQAEATFGPVAILVNNAAHWGPPDTLLTIEPNTNPFHANTFQQTLTAANFDRHTAVNARAVALMMIEFARRHQQRGSSYGRIINISTDGANCFPNELSYGASKAALESLSRSAAVEFGPLGINVNILSPGPTQTGDPGWITPEMEQQIAQRTPLGRAGRPEDLADAIVFLASHQSRWITGQLLRVNGGHMI